MPWQEATKVSLRLEFVLEALEEGANIRALCREYNISPTTGYKWIDRYQEEGRAGLTIARITVRARHRREQPRPP